VEVVNWLNSNQGFVMTILTAVYAIATIIIVFYNHKSIKEMENAREANLRPYVFAYLHKDPRDLCFYFRIKNYGKTGARVDSIQISPSLKFIYNSDVKDFLNRVILPPQQMLQFIVVEEKEETLQHEYKIQIRYSAVYKKSKKYREEYTLVVQYAHQMGYTNSKSSNLSDEANQLQNIANYLDCIRSKI